MKTRAFFYSTVLMGFMAAPALAQASPLSCTHLFSGASLALHQTSSWSDLSKTRTKPVDASLIANMKGERMTAVIAGGSSLHAIVDGQTSAKIYFRPPGPQTHADLTRALADAAIPSLKMITETPGKDPVLFVPAPGLVVDQGRAIELPGNFGVIGRTTYELPRLLQEELARRGHANVKVFVKNDSFTLAATIGSDPRAKPGRRVKLVFAGTGLGETNIVTVKGGVFRERATESGHLRVHDYPGLVEKLPYPIVEAAEMGLRGHESTLPLEFENLVAGGRSEHHVGGLLSVIVSARLNDAEVPAWILRGNGGKRPSWGAHGREMQLESQHPEDLALVRILAERKSISLEMVSEAARKGAPMAQALLAKVIYTQGFISGVMGTEFGETPAGVKLPSHFVFEGLSEKRLSRDVQIRADGALMAWTQMLPVASRGFKDAVDFQFKENSVYREKLRASGIDPSWVKADSFRMIFGADRKPLADADLEGLATLSRENFVR